VNIDNFGMNLSSKKTINCNGSLINFEIPKIMGILNITPDSFYDGGKYTNLSEIKLQIDQLFENGADIIDIGAYSSRPGATPISPDEEMDRLKPVLELINKFYSNKIFSIDTFRAEVASWAVKNYGIAIVNDISAGDMDANMFETIAQLQIPYVIMHMQGTPENMQENPKYNNIVEDIIKYFSKKLEKLKKLGIHDIILDPGFGFGKTIDHNYQILNNLNEFKIFSLPILAGLSRKSMIYKYLNCNPELALNGTTVLNTIALTKGADILRVHDALEAKQTIQLFEKCRISK
jgi:dihydropteroate synthase